jgi:hypothetical protein
VFDGTAETVLHFPDNTVTLRWLAGDKATATFAGTVPKAITFTTVDGVTRFRLDDKLYFLASDRAAAAAQLRTLRWAPSSSADRAGEGVQPSTVSRTFAGGYRSLMPSKNRHAMP